MALVDPPDDVDPASLASAWGATAHVVLRGDDVLAGGAAGLAPDGVDLLVHWRAPGSGRPTPDPVAEALLAAVRPGGIWATVVDPEAPTADLASWHRALVATTLARDVVATVAVEGAVVLVRRGTEPAPEPSVRPTDGLAGSFGPVGAVAVEQLGWSGP